MTAAKSHGFEWTSSAKDSARAAASLEGLAIPTFAALHREVKGAPPAGPKWEAFRTIHNVNSTLQRLIARLRNRVETSFKEITDQMELARHGAHPSTGC